MANVKARCPHCNETHQVEMYFLSHHTDIVAVCPTCKEIISQIEKGAAAASEQLPGGVEAKIDIDSLVVEKNINKKEN